MGATFQERLDQFHRELLRLLSAKQYAEVAKGLLSLAEPSVRFVVAERLVTELIGGESWTANRALRERLPMDELIRHFTDYACACEAVLKEDPVQVDFHLRTATWILHRYDEEWLRPTQLKLLNQSIYCDTGLSLTEKEPESNLLRCAGDIKEKCAIVLSANGIYFDHFAEPFLESTKALPESSMIWMQIANPTDTTMERAAILKEKSPRPVTFIMEESANRPVRFTCRRFEGVLALLAAGVPKILMVDIDTRFTPMIPLFFERAMDFDIGLYQAIGVNPGVRCHCSLVVINNTDRSRRFFSVLCDYIAKKLLETDALWMLDQCAMFIVSRLMMKGAPTLPWPSPQELQWMPLELWTRKPLAEFQINQESGGKHQLRTESQKDFGSLHRRVIFEPNQRPRLCN